MGNRCTHSAGCTGRQQLRSESLRLPRIIRQSTMFGLRKCPPVSKRPLAAAVRRESSPGEEASLWLIPWVPFVTAVTRCALPPAASLSTTYAVQGHVEHDAFPAAAAIRCTAAAAIAVHTRPTDSDVWLGCASRPPQRRAALSSLIPSCCRRDLLGSFGLHGNTRKGFQQRAVAAGGSGRVWCRGRASWRRWRRLQRSKGTSQLQLWNFRRQGRRCPRSVAGIGSCC